MIQSKINGLKIAQTSGVLAENISFAVNAELTRSLLDKNGVKYETAPGGEPLPVPTVAERALKFTVMVQCYGRAPAVASGTGG